MSKKGRRWEHEVANNVTRRSRDGVFAWPIGYSGNNAVPCPDILIVTEGRLLGVEQKKWSNDTDGVAESDLEQLLELQTNYLDVALLVSFSHREPVLVEPSEPSLPAFDLSPSVGAAENFKRTVPAAFEPRVTDGGKERTLRFSKPSTDEWPSAQKGQDAVEILLEWIR